MKHLGPNVRAYRQSDGKLLAYKGKQQKDEEHDE
jgi:hypothetical protein